MNYLKYEIETEADQIELLIGHLSVLPFEAFEEKENSIDAYLAANEDSVQVNSDLEQLKNRYHFSYLVTEVPDQNWNALWESNFQPIQIKDFCYIHAPFHQPNPAVKYNLLIEPKMAFGTGHHETTYMMIDLMEGLNFKHKSVFDYGCGTGILAIMASFLGANTIDAVDIDEWAVSNTLENATINNCNNIRTKKGTIDTFRDQSYDIILANINRNVILATLSDLKSQLKPEGQLLISGILNVDKSIIMQCAEKLDLVANRTLTKGDWQAIELMHL